MKHKLSTVLITVISIFSTSLGFADSTVEPSNKKLEIASIEIKRNADYYPLLTTNETPESCANFSLNQKIVIDFFNKAEAQPKETFNLANCFASGRLALKNGEAGKWIIYRSRMAVVIFDKDKAVKHYYFCSTCDPDVKLFYGYIDEKTLNEDPDDVAEEEQ